MDAITLHSRKLALSLLRATARLVAFAVLVAALVAALLVYGWLHPDEGPGYLSFQLGYHLLGPAATLPRYQQQLARVNEGLIPPPVDLYLSRRLVHGAGEPEGRAIQAFFLRQGQGRRGLFLSLAWPAAKAQGLLVAEAAP